MGSGWGWGGVLGDPGRGGGGDPALLLGERSLGAERGWEGLVLPHRTRAPPLRSPAGGSGPGSGQQEPQQGGWRGRGVPQAACKRRGRSLPPSRQPHGGPRLQASGPHQAPGPERGVEGPGGGGGSRVSCFPGQS